MNPANDALTSQEKEFSARLAAQYGKLCCVSPFPYSNSFTFTREDPHTGRYLVHSVAQDEYHTEVNFCPYCGKDKDGKLPTEQQNEGTTI